MLHKVQTAHQLWRHFGPEWLARRLSYATRMRMGSVRRKLPAVAWDDQTLGKFLSDAALASPESYLDYRRAGAPAFLFSPSRRTEYQPLFEAWDEGASITPIAISEQLARGEMRYFERTTALTGFPPDWHANPFTGERVPADLHWSEIGDFEHGDIKIIWEPSRFGFAYSLVRAYWRSGDESYAELFWKATEDWRDKNPPQLGPNWKCGQEISFRVMAWCFALYGFLESEASTAERVAKLAQMVAVSGCRIEANLGYALSQRNNHGISEAAGLFTIGESFPELRAATRWKRIGREALERQGRELIYDDGSFSQHSVNYQRLMLHDYLWSLRIADLNGENFSDELKQRVSNACELLCQVQDGPSGRVPCYGHNDGSLILPLNNCDYVDFRPVIQATHYLSSGRRLYESGPWDEDLLWLFGAAAVSAPVDGPKRADVVADVGGYYTLRSDSGFAFVRCAGFRDRPGQADMLHVDLWWRGTNVALDPGTYSYNAPAPWDNPFAHTAYHNTVTVDDADQMERAGKFLWLPWLRGSVRSNKRSSADQLAYWEGEHDGYERLRSPVNHRRGVLRIGEESWLILDRLTSHGSHRYRLHWLLPDLPFAWDEGRGRLTLRTPAGDYVVTVVSTASERFSLVRADQTSPRGWRAPYYNDREPALSLAVEAQAESRTFLTLFAPASHEILVRESEATVSAGSLTARFKLSAGDDATLLRFVSLSGGADTLELT